MEETKESYPTGGRGVQSDHIDTSSTTSTSTTTTTRITTSSGVLWSGKAGFSFKQEENKSKVAVGNACLDVFKDVEGGRGQLPREGELAEKGRREEEPRVIFTQQISPQKFSGSSSSSSCSTGAPKRTWGAAFGLKPEQVGQ